MADGPIYCAEQIVVPPNLADVLKNYTKEVLRKQPVNLLEFSASYFTDLAKAASGISSITPPTAGQLAGAYAQLADRQTATIGELTAACEAAGISGAVVLQVLQASCVSTSGPIEVAQALLLLLTLSCDSFRAVVAGLFQVFGETMPAALFQRLLRLVGTKDRANAGSAVQEEVAVALAGLDAVAYQDLTNCPILWSKLT